MKAKLTKKSVLDEGDCPNPKQPGPKGAALTLLITIVFQQSLIGAGNVALESRLNDQAITTKQNAVNQIASSLGKNAVVDSYG
ncbi:hypothetical protein LEP1GSC050_1828, partial [Leptospira broomii serovar Hurstbridge str. 5399]